MGRLCTIWRKEFSSYWSSPIAYIVITVFLVIMNFFFFRTFFLQGEANVRGYFMLLPWTFLFLMPALTMRQWAEEVRSGTIESLLTNPIREWEVVVGKFTASLVFLAVVLLLTLPTPITIAGISENGLDWGVLFTSYLGALLIGAAYLAIGGWVSSLTSNQIIAFILGLALIFAMIMVGEAVITFFAPAALVPTLEYLGLKTHFNSIARGVIDTRDLVYYVSVIFLFLYLTVRVIENRKWS